MKLYLKFGGQHRELRFCRLVLLDLGKGHVHTQRPTYYPRERVLLCHNDLLFCSSCSYVTRPGKGLPQASTGQSIPLLLAPNGEFCLGHIKSDIQVEMLRRQLYI